MDSSASSTDTLLRLVAWLDKNKKRLGLITGAVVVVAGIIAGIIYYQSQKEARASEALSNIRVPVNLSTPTPPGTLDAYLKLARDYEGTQAAGRALLEAGSLYYTEGNFTSAEAQYKRFLHDYPESPFLQQGMLGLASTLDAEGKTPEAKDKYEELRRRFPTDSVADETKLALARIYEKSNLAEAYRLYNELAAMGSQSGIGSEAGMRLADLVEAHPELAKTNAPPTSVTPSPRPAPQVSMIKKPTTNQMVMSITNLPKPAPATSAAPLTPLLLKPEASTNK